MSTLFDSTFRHWLSEACRIWNYPEPSEEYFDLVFNRLPEGLRLLLSYGIENKIIISHEHTFTLKGLSDSKGPYNWFSRSNTKKPLPNWEYYVQVAEYVRLYEKAKKSKYELKFEDDLMDLAIYDGSKLIACYEVKEKAIQLKRLLNQIKKYQTHIDFKMPDRGNDALRKAKYLFKNRPNHFCGIAIGVRNEYKVDYPEGIMFQLKEDFIPLI